MYILNVLNVMLLAQLRLFHRIIDLYGVYAFACSHFKYNITYIEY